MPRITQLKTIDGHVWARIDHDPDDGAVHLFTDEELRYLQHQERKALWNELMDVINRYKE